MEDPMAGKECRLRHLLATYEGNASRAEPNRTQEAERQAAIAEGYTWRHLLATHEKDASRAESNRTSEAEVQTVTAKRRTREADMQTVTEWQQTQSQAFMARQQEFDPRPIRQEKTKKGSWQADA